jgi:hypothetical protein
MRISELQLCLLDFHAISSVDDPGIWSLLKVRSLAHLTILGPRRCIVPEVRKWLKARTQKKTSPMGRTRRGESWAKKLDKSLEVSRRLAILAATVRTNGLTLGTNTCTTERQSPRDVQSNVWPITSGEEDGLCRQKGGGTASSLTAVNPTSLHSGAVETRHNASKTNVSSQMRRQEMAASSGSLPNRPSEHDRKYFHISWLESFQSRILRLHPL